MKEQIVAQVQQFQVQDGFHDITEEQKQTKKRTNILDAFLTDYDRKDLMEELHRRKSEAHDEEL